MGLSSGQACTALSQKKMKTKWSVTTAARLTGALIALVCATFHPVLGRAAEPARRNSTSPLSIALTAQKVIQQSDGKEKLLAADRALPGEVIQYDALYENQGSRALNNVAPILPIPAGMIFLPDSANPVPVEASLDGTTFERIPLKRKVTLASGEIREQEIPATEYRALRWQLGEMQPGARATLIARTRIASVVP
jgi:uncharacterized repeat protein (TIGR01451 family)